LGGSRQDLLGGSRQDAMQLLDLAKLSVQRTAVAGHALGAKRRFLRWCAVAARDGRVPRAVAAALYIYVACDAHGAHDGAPNVHELDIVGAGAGRVNIQEHELVPTSSAISKRKDDVSAPPRPSRRARTSASSRPARTLTSSPTARLSCAGRKDTRFTSASRWVPSCRTVCRVCSM